MERGFIVPVSCFLSCSSALVHRSVTFQKLTKTGERERERGRLADVEDHSYQIIHPQTLRRVQKLEVTSSRSVVWIHRYGKQFSVTGSLLCEILRALAAADEAAGGVGRWHQAAGSKAKTLRLVFMPNEIDGHDNLAVRAAKINSSSSSSGSQVRSKPTMGRVMKGLVDGVRRVRDVEVVDGENFAL